MYARHSQTHTYADTYERDKHTHFSYESKKERAQNSPQKSNAKESQLHPQTYICMYMFEHTHMHTHMCACVFVHIHTYVHMCCYCIPGGRICTQGG